MTNETFLKLLQGTLEDIQIACNWLVENHDPVKYITEYSNAKRESPVGCLPIKFRDIEDVDVFSTGTGRLYYKYDYERFIIVSEYGISVTNRRYNGNLPLINH